MDMADDALRNEESTGEPSVAPFVPSSPVEIVQNEETRSEIVHLITSWLIRQGFTSSAQLLREEAASQLKVEHQQRKALRGMCRGVEEGSWELVGKNMKKLISKTPNKANSKVESPSQIISLARLLPFLLAEQQFLELVDSDDDQKTFSFFMKTIKPFESTIGWKHFQRLNYLLTCKTVAEAAGAYPEYRSWSPEVGRLQLINRITEAIGSSLSHPYTRPTGITGGTAVSSQMDLDRIIAQSLSYDLIQKQYPTLTRDTPKLSVSSIFKSLDSQTPPCEPMLSVNMNDIVRDKFPAFVSKAGRPLRLTACQPFLSHSSFVVGTHRGAVLWIPLETTMRRGKTVVKCEETLLLTHPYPVRGLARHGAKLLVWGGPHAVVLSLASWMEEAADGEAGCVVNQFHHMMDVFCSCFFPCGTIVATGLSDGMVSMWDANNGSKMYDNSYNNFPVVSLVPNHSGTTYFAATKDGVIRMVDTATGITTLTLAAPVAMEIVSLAMSPSSSVLLSSYRGGILRMWDVLTGNLLPHRLVGVENNTRLHVPVTFGALDFYIYSSSEDGGVYFWNLQSQREARTDATAHDPLDREQANALKPITSRWPSTLILPPTTQLHTHNACVMDIKVEDSFLMSCGEDGLVYIFNNGNERKD
ncbi:WD domain, G-beta repeat, putative [Angomonas deanei]|uniref:WD domain, G-beta repeat, putative n=1 Tax=Angomonas deanei TaxID=59799 RepID=A0A7G2CML3_9TRYP|nr:WD domain, G-beta repeat, putative [Angomonas deanei]